MTMEGLTFTNWLAESKVSEATLTPEQRCLLQSAFQFLQARGGDYYSSRLLSHFLLHAKSGLKVAAIARLLGFSRAAASAQQGLSSKEVVQATHHRLAGRSHGKLLPRYAGPVAQFLLEHPKATRYDLLDFIERTWNVRVSRMALHKFLKKYGLDDASRIVVTPLPSASPTGAPPPVPPPTESTPGAPATADGVGTVAATVVQPPPAGQPVPLPADAFFLPPPSTPAPSCCCPRPSSG
jgi:hypothetical protein